ncbi:1616_t:CDS:2, partial [Paraglomus occultum]
MEFTEETSHADEVNSVNSDMRVPENTELKTTHETENSGNTNGSTTLPVSTEFVPSDTLTLSDDLPNFNYLPSNGDRSLNGFDDTNGEFAWRGTDGTIIKNLYRLIELRSDTSTTGTVDKAIIHPPDLENLCNALAPESYHSIADIRFEKLGKEHLDLVGCFGNRELILKLLLQSNCINQDRFLTKLTNHQFCLMSDDDLKNFLWQHPQTGLSGTTRSNRSFNLKVTKNQEQQRSVDINNGFDIILHRLPNRNSNSSTAYIVESVSSQSVVIKKHVPAKVTTKEEIKQYNSRDFQKFGRSIREGKYSLKVSNLGYKELWTLVEE